MSDWLDELSASLGEGQFTNAVVGALLALAVAVALIVDELRGKGEG